MAVPDYTRTTWVNTQTSANEVSMNKIEAQIAALTDAAKDLALVDNTPDEDKPLSLAERTALAQKRDRVLTRKTLTANYTLTSADAATDTVLHCTNTANITVTLPSDTAANIPQELAIPVRQFGTGTVTVAAGTGATLLTPAVSGGRFTEMTVRKVGASSWMVTGSFTASGGTTAPTEPGVPTAVAATANSGGATLNWGAPASTGGSAITGYVVTLNGAATTVSATTLSRTYTGLTNGTQYTLTVAAVNSVGTGAAVTVTVTPTGGSTTPPASTGFTSKVLADPTVIRYFPMDADNKLLDVTGGAPLANTGGGVTFSDAGALFQGRTTDYLTAPSSTDFSVRKTENVFSMFMEVTFPTYTQPDQFHFMGKGADQPDNFEWAMRLYGDSNTARARNISNYYWNPNPSFDINGGAVASRRGSGAYLAPPAAAPDFGGSERHNGPPHSGEIGVKHWLGIEFTYAANYAGRCRLWYGDSVNPMTLLSDRQMNADALVTPVYTVGRLFIGKRGDSDGMAKMTMRRLIFSNAIRTQTQWRALINATNMALPE